VAAGGVSSAVPEKKGEAAELAGLTSRDSSNQFIIGYGGYSRAPVGVGAVPPHFREACDRTFGVLADARYRALAC